MAPKPNIWVLRSQTNRIIKAHRSHFLTLVIIFLLPLSSLILLYPTLFFQLLNHFFGPFEPSITLADTISVQELLPCQLLNHFSSYLSQIHSQHQPINLTLLFFHLLYSFFILLFSFGAISTITYSILQGFYGQPLNLLSTIQPIFTSFLPFLATTIVLKVIFFLISLLFGLLLFLVITISHSSPHFLWFSHFSSVLVVLAFLFVVVHLQVKWTLVPVIVVVESSWGLEPLRRSASLMKGMKGVAVCLLFFFGFLEGPFVWFGPVLKVLLMGSNGITFDWGQIMLLIVGKSVLLALLLLLNIAVNSVLYIFCKAIHGEVGKEFGKGYVGLPIDDGKVPRVV